MKYNIVLAAGIAAGIILASHTNVRAEGEKTADELAKESEAACTATASTKPTPQMIIEKVKEAVELVEKEGKASFPKFQGKDSKFIFAGTYIWVHDFDGVMLMHPIKNKLVGQSCLAFQDSAGKKFFVEMIELCKTKDAGWTEYMWPKPGQKESVPKISYVKKAKCDGKEVVVGCGVYDMTMEEVTKAAAAK